MSTSSLLHLPVTCIAVLRDISIGTSYQIVRLVFRPYTHLMPSSWTSERLRSSISVSPDFNHNRYSSLSFGSYHHNSSISLGYWLPIIHLAIMEISMVRVSIRVWQVTLLSCIFTVSLSKWDFFIFPSQYFFSIGLPIVFSLGCCYHPHSHCTTKQCYSLLCSTKRGYHSLWLLFP